ncbi:MAG: hypothetical protein KIS92_05830 [Planctomycetota bacterium]|nr:hypothetical protein [Planctomycetota bacterium]
MRPPCDSSPLPKPEHEQKAAPFQFSLLTLMVLIIGYGFTYPVAHYQYRKFFPDHLVGPFSVDVFLYAVLTVTVNLFLFYKLVQWEKLSDLKRAGLALVYLVVVALVSFPFFYGLALLFIPPNPFKKPDDGKDKEKTRA